MSVKHFEGFRHSFWSYACSCLWGFFKVGGSTGLTGSTDCEIFHNRMVVLSHMLNAQNTTKIVVLVLYGIVFLGGNPLGSNIIQ